MALPIWGLYMKKCYNDASLSISTDEFEAPNNLRIRVDCTSDSDTQQTVTPLPDFDF